MAYPLFLTKLLIRTGLARWLPTARRLGADTDALPYLSDRLLAGPHAALATAAAFLELHEPDGIDLALGRRAATRCRRPHDQGLIRAATRRPTDCPNCAKPSPPSWGRRSARPRCW